MQYTTFQGVNSKTFQPPLLDGSLALPELIALHAKNSPTHPVFRYESTAPKELTSVDWAHTFLAIETARQLLESRLDLHVPALSSRGFVAILASSDSMTFFAVIHGLMRAGYVPFPISTRNSAAAVTHLLKTTNCMHLIVSHDMQLQDIATAVLQDLEHLQVIDMPCFDDLYCPSDPVTAMEVSSHYSRPALDDIAVIYHSSGSTRFPSPIFLTHRLILQICTLPYYGEIELCDKIFAAQTLPLFHLMGFWCVCQMVSSGMVLAVFSPSEAPSVPTSESLLSSIGSLGCQVVFTVPSFLEEWSKSAEMMAKLQSLTIFFGGGALSNEAGDILQANGVNFATTYGLTETGMLTVLHIPPRSIGWDWQKTASHVNMLMVPEEGNTFRVYIKACSLLSPAVVNTEIDGVKAFDTKDLVIRHSTNPAYWKIYGRADDQIIHSTGEKTNPVPIEGTLLGDKHVATAVMFGRAKFQTGVLILPKPEFVFDPADVKKLAEFRNAIWDTVTLANSQAPQHSRIYKEMILVASPSKPFEITSKGTVRRGVILKLYADEIEKLYDSIASISLSDVPLPTVWDLENTSALVRRIMCDILGRSLQDDTNIFEVGGDSLAATSVRSAILRAMRDSKVVSLASLRLLPQNFVFEYSTITALSAYIYAFIVESFNTPSVAEIDDEDEDYYPMEAPLPMSGQTVVKLREGPGVPLIIIHGAGGMFFEYSSYSEKFKSAVWTLQVTPDTPLTTLHEMAAFYHSKIKEQQPVGPYRFAAYSATSILGFALAKVFEDNGDVVAQLAMLDHFPLLFVYTANRLGNPNPNEGTNRDRIVTVAIDSIMGFVERDANRSTMEKPFQIFFDAVKGGTAPDVVKFAASTAKKYMGLVADFVYALTTDINGASSLNALVAWMNGVRAPVTVYVAQLGALGNVEELDREEWNDLGARYLTGAQVVEVGGGHYEFLMDEKVIQDLQVGF